MSWRLSGVVAVVLGALLGGPLRAGPITYAYVFDQANYNVAPGGTVAVTVSVQETIDPGLGQVSLLQTLGLAGGGLQVNFADPVPTQPARVLTTADVVANPAFDVTVPSVPADDPPLASAGLLEISSSALFGGPGVVALGGGPTTFSVPLGTFLFHAGSVVGEVTHVSATDTDVVGGVPSDNNVIAGIPGTVLDSFLVGPGATGHATITVVGQQPAVAVPEPGALLLFFVGLVGLAGLAGSAVRGNRLAPRPK